MAEEVESDATKGKKKSSLYLKMMCDAVCYADLVDQFRTRLKDRPEGPSDAVAAIETLLDLIRSSKGPL